MAVKKAVQNGNVEDAIEKVNDLNPEVHTSMLLSSCLIDCERYSRIKNWLCLQILDTNPELFFHLQQQRLIELIRQGKTEEALEFAQEELAPRGEENVSILLIGSRWRMWSFYIYIYIYCLQHLCLFMLKAWSNAILFVLSAASVSPRAGKNCSAACFWRCI